MEDSEYGTHKALPSQNKVISPVVTRARRSRSMSGNEGLVELPLKKRRRSSVKRKSLVETLASVTKSFHDQAKDARSPSNDIEKGNKTSKNDHRISAAVNNADNSLQSAVSVMGSRASPSVLKDDGHQTSFPLVDENVLETSFLLNRYSTLKNEVQEWKDLLHKHELAAKEEKQKSHENCLDNEIDKHTTEVKCTDFCGVSKSVDELEQRFSVAVSTVTECVNAVNELRVKQEQWLQTFVIAEANRLSNDKDVRSIICNIFEYDESLEPFPCFST